MLNRSARDNSTPHLSQTDTCELLQYEYAKGYVPTANPKQEEPPAHDDRLHR